ncbi:hypothetical protein [Novosphingobium sp. HR1a]|nr:hypothetical protein [Novosphingobium sp. HR1a]
MAIETKPWDAAEDGTAHPSPPLALSSDPADISVARRVMTIIVREDR